MTLWMMCAFLMKAQSDGDMTEVFVPVTDWNELKDGEPCLVVATDSIFTNQWVGGMYAMSTTLKKGKFLAQKCGEADCDRIKNPASNLRWKILQTINGLYLQSYVTDNYISSAGASTLQLQPDKEDALLWKESWTTDGLVMLYSPAYDKYLGLNVSSNSDSYFSCYSLSGQTAMHLQLFHLEKGYVSDKGAEMQPDGAQVVLQSEDNFLLPDINGAMSVRSILPFEMTDGSIANDGGLRPWSFVALDENRFMLQLSDAEGLDYQLRSSGIPAPWRIVNGCIATDEQPARFLVCHEGQPALIGEEELSDGTCQPVSFRTMGEPAGFTYPQEGCIKLTGTWSALRMANIEWTGIHSIDCCQMIWPRNPLNFTERPTERPTFLFVNRQDISYVPENWDFVVACSQNGDNALLRGGILPDRQPFAVAADFTISEDQLYYERNCYADGGWETICLPFDTEVPQGLLAETLVEAGDNELVFTPTSTIPANTPALLYVSPDRADDTKLTFRANAGSIVSHPDFPTPFKGNYQSMSVTDDKEGVFMLNATGDTFVRALSGSHLSPYRAYLLLKEGDTRGVRHTTTHIVTASGSVHTNAVYTMDGRKVLLTENKGCRETLPPGIYIMDGRKFIVSRR